MDTFERRPAIKIICEQIVPLSVLMQRKPCNECQVTAQEYNLKYSPLFLGIKIMTGI